MSNEYLDWLADNLLDLEEKEQSKDKEDSNNNETSNTVRNSCHRRTSI